MAAVNFVVMGKTGAGKSTLINAVLGKELAPTGSGSAVTKEVHIYSETMSLRLPESTEYKESVGYRMINRKVNLYDTVGLEIDSAITKKTLEDIRAILYKTKAVSDEKDITLVWFCINAASSRFEKYEAELIKDLSLEYEIPFVIVLTQCFSDERGELELEIAKDFPEISTVRILAKDYRIRGGAIPAFGVDDLLTSSITEYSEKRVDVLQSKLDKLLNSRAAELDRMKSKGNRIIKKYSAKATKIGILPIGSIPFVHGLCAKMIHELNGLYGVKGLKGEAAEHIGNAAVVAFVTPLMAVPLLSAATANAYIGTVGEDYLKILSKLASEGRPSIEVSRIYEELEKQKK